MRNPFETSPWEGPPDEELAQQAAGGDRAALELLVRRHQDWIFNIALRMFQTHEDAEDCAQEVLVKIVTRLGTFRGESAFRTWAYRIVANHVLDRRRSRAEEAVGGFDCYSRYLDSAVDEDLDAEFASPQERHVLIEEARLACTMGMLLCLSREQRLVFVFGEMLGTSDRIGAEVLGLTRANFRQQLSRARRQLAAYLKGRCGLVDPANPCRCARKTRAFIRDGIVDPERLVFHAPAVEAARRNAADIAGALDGIAVYRGHPLQVAPDLAERLGALVGDGQIAAVLRLSEDNKGDVQ